VGRSFSRIDERRVRLGEKGGGGGLEGRGGGGGIVRWQREEREAGEKGRIEAKMGIQNLARQSAMRVGEEIGRVESGQEMAEGKPDLGCQGLGEGRGREEG